jgi:hypothetical protein
MTRHRVFIAASALLLGAACISTSFAQPAGYNGYFPGYYSASTAAEGFQNGRSNVIRSQGQFLLDSSQAASQFEDARAKDIENRYKTTQAYFDLRRMNREGRAAEAGPRPTQADLVRWAQAGRPKPLTSSDLNPNNGELLWPKALTINAFDDERFFLQGMMSERAKYGSLSLDQVLAVSRTVDKMLAGLKDRIGDFPPNMYLEGKNFLESLKYAVNQ